MGFATRRKRVKKGLRGIARNHEDTFKKNGLMIVVFLREGRHFRNARQSRKIISYAYNLLHQ